MKQKNAHKLDTKESFIEKAKKTHGERYNYDLVKYKKSKDKVIIICEIHGEFIQAPTNHLKGQGCKRCATDAVVKRSLSNIEEFVSKAINIHKDLYDYSKVEYINNYTKVIIICKQHGAFEQTPTNHLKCKHICPNCTKKYNTYTTEQFIEKASKVHNNLYDYSESVYKTGEIKVSILCKEHGKFEQKPVKHLQGSGCYKCARYKVDKNKKKTPTNFIKEAQSKHVDKYSYEKTNYTTIREKVTITCAIHGDFEQTANAHLRGAGCQKCGVTNGGAGYSRSSYVKKADGRICTFYILRCFKEKEKFYKIGITMKDIKQRYPNNSTMPYNYEIISEIFGEAGFIWDLEKEEKRKLKQFHYIPIIDFKGSVTECFTQYSIDEK